MVKPITGQVDPARINKMFREEAEEDAARESLGPKLPTYSVAQLPAAAQNTGRLVRCSDGAAGQPCLALSNGTSWLRIALGAAVATS